MPPTTRTDRAKLSDRNDQHWSRTPYRSAYRALLGPAPVCRPGDFERARQFLQRIHTAIDRGGWSKTERNRLYKLRDRWARRANGQDARFGQHGNVAGRLSATQQRDVDRQQRARDLLIREVPRRGRT